MQLRESKRFLQNLDLLAIHCEKEVYKKASEEKIKEIINEMGVRNQYGQKFTLASSVHQFKKFGPGVYLMFHFLKSITIIFAILALLSLVQFFLLIKSPYYQGYEEIVRINLLRLTIASLEQDSHQIYIFFDFIITLAFMFWIIWWKQQEQKIIEKCNQVCKLPSYLTVVLDELPEDYSEDRLKKILERDGSVHVEEIYSARYFEEKLDEYKKINEVANQFRLSLQISDAEISQENNFKEVKKMLDKFFELQQLYENVLNKKFNESKFQPVRAYIVLRFYSERQLALKRYSSTPACFATNQNEYSIKLKPCQVQPESIKWENIGYPKWKYILRILAVFMLLSLVTCLGVIIIFVLEIMETAAIGDAYYFSEKDKVSGAHDYCVSLSPVSFLRQASACQQFVPDYFKLGLLVILVPITIFICKKVIMLSLSSLVHFTKHQSEVSLIKTQILAISFFYFIVAGVLHLVLYLKAQSSTHTLSLYEILYPLTSWMFSFTNYNPASIHLYSDFSFDWYKEATFFIILISSTSFNISNIWKLIVSLVSLKLQIYQAKKEKTIYRVRQKLKGIHLHIEDAYSSAIVIIYFSFLYFAAIPIVLLFGFISLLTLFWVCKFIFIKRSQKLLRMSHSINRMITQVLMGAVFVHCIISPIFLGAPGIGVAPQSYQNKYDSKTSAAQANEENILNIGQRYGTIGILYFIILGLLMIYLLFGKYIKKLILKIVNKFKKESEIKKSSTQFKGLFPSYSMHNNSKYRQILKIVYLLNKTQARRETCRMDENLRVAFEENKTLHKSTYDKKSRLDVSQGIFEDEPLFEKMMNVLEKQCGIKLYEEEIKYDSRIPRSMVDRLVELYLTYDSYSTGSEKEQEQSKQVKKRERSSKDRIWMGNQKSEYVCDKVIEVDMPADSGSRINSEQI